MNETIYDICCITRRKTTYNQENNNIRHFIGREVDLRLIGTFLQAGTDDIEVLIAAQSVGSDDLALKKG